MRTSAIKITNLHKSFGTGKKTKKILNGLTLKISRGEVFGFLGPNGAGKSTTIKMIMNFLHPNSGEICVMGNTVGRDEFRKHIGYLSEFPCFYEHLTAKETLYLSGSLSGIPRKKVLQNTLPLLERMNLGEVANHRVSEFSKGMKQRLGVANSLIHDPEILIFDEPMSGLDPLGRALIKELILQLKHDNKTVFFSSHILSDIEDLCDRIGILHKGHLLYSGTISNFITEKRSLEECFVAAINEVNNAAVK